MEYQTYNFNSFNLYTIKTNKFKNCHLEVVFREKLTKEKIIPRKFLIELLSYSTQKFNTQRKLNIYLEELYNANLYAVTSRVGKCLLTNFCLDFLNPKYCEEGYLEKILNLITEVIFAPNDYSNESFQTIKNNILDEVKISMENPRTLAYRNLFKIMDENADLAYDMIGTKEEIECITKEDIQKDYKRLFEEAYCDIYLIGDLDMDKMKEYFENNFIFRTIKNYDLEIFSSGKTRSKIKVKKENADIKQANLLIGCNIDNPDVEQKDIIGYLYNYILGGSSLNTKLAKYLRQDNSLCYTANSIYQKYDSVIILYAGIDKKNYNKAVTLMKKALKEISNKITPEELENAKKGIITSLNMIYDNPSTIINNYLFLNIANLQTVEERIKNVKKVTVDDIKKFAKKVKINTIYLLSGVEK